MLKSSFSERSVSKGAMLSITENREQGSYITILAECESIARFRDAAVTLGGWLQAGSAIPYMGLRSLLTRLSLQT